MKARLFRRPRWLFAPRTVCCVCNTTTHIGGLISFFNNHHLVGSACPRCEALFKRVQHFKEVSKRI